MFRELASTAVVSPMAAPVSPIGQSAVTPAATTPVATPTPAADSPTVPPAQRNGTQLLNFPGHKHSCTLQHSPMRQQIHDVFDVQHRASTV